MKKSMRFLLVFVLVWAIAITPASAQQRYGLRRVAVSEDTALVLPAGTWVYGIGIHATSASAEFAIYDVATLGAATVANMGNGDEIGEASQYDSAEKPFPKPRYFTNGVTAIVNNGVGFIEYGPQP